jgi:hypothetical protein
MDKGKRVSGAPEAGGATTAGSVFGGRTFVAHALRLLARVARGLESTAYRRLRDMEARRTGATHPGDERQPGAPRRVKGAARLRRQPT